MPPDECRQKLHKIFHLRHLLRRERPDVRDQTLFDSRIDHAFPSRPLAHTDISLLAVVIPVSRARQEESPR